MSGRKVKKMRWNKINQKQQISSCLKWENKLEKKNVRKQSFWFLFLQKSLSSNLFVIRRKSVGS